MKIFKNFLWINSEREKLDIEIDGYGADRAKGFAKLRIENLWNLSIYFYLLFLLIFNANSKDNYFCLSNGKNSILLVSKNYPNISEVKYYPYLKSIKISEIIKKEYSDDAGEKPEVYYNMNELINEKNTGKYVFMSRGYVLYSVDYLNFKSKKIAEFSRIYNYEINLKNINCL